MQLRMYLTMNLENKCLVEVLLHAHASTMYANVVKVIPSLEQALTISGIFLHPNPLFFV